MSEWIVDKRRSEACTSCPMCLHKRPLCTIDACTVRRPYRSDFIIHLRNFNCSSCRCTGTVIDLLGRIHSFTLPALHECSLWCFIGTIRLLLRRPFQRYMIFVFGLGFLTRMGRNTFFKILTPYYVHCHYFTLFFVETKLSVIASPSQNIDAEQSSGTLPSTSLLSTINVLIP
ncbi:hypothetical protein TNCV_4720731 [Trichonephila clavipes]|uniref:Uncharacterized protein n=1 Tax=Trichonephila clavipes TaxID=2585209 RepID=A0A8X6W6E5_TRICX|nr:hypothetical protein TNCV_4720731 [Trichonephila clavipes]